MTPRSGLSQQPAKLPHDRHVQGCLGAPTGVTAVSPSLCAFRLDRICQTALPGGPRLRARPEARPPCTVSAVRFRRPGGEAELCCPHLLPLLSSLASAPWSWDSWKLLVPEGVWFCKGDAMHAGECWPKTGAEVPMRLRQGSTQPAALGHICPGEELGTPWPGCRTRHHLPRLCWAAGEATSSVGPLQTAPRRVQLCPAQVPGLCWAT